MAANFEALDVEAKPPCVTLQVVSDRGHILWVEERRDRLPSSREKFDRLAFAQRALALLRPAATRVALYHCRSEIKIEHGRDLEFGPDARWATVGIPPDASREHIAVALAELAEVPVGPYVIESLLALARTDPQS